MAADAELVPLAGGPVATVFAGVDATTGEAFALKVFPGPLDRRARAELDAELGRQAALRSQAAVLVADRVDALPDGRCALRMELCAQSLPDLVDSFGPLSVADTLVLGTVLAATLATAHQAGLVHGSVTPGNVLFRSSGEPVLSDFGQTLRHAFPRDPLSTLEVTAPETVRDGSTDERSDLYGLGVVLYLALSGQLPHRGQLGEEPGERLLRVLGGPVPRLRRGDAPAELVTLVSELLAREPEARPADAVAVAERLDTLRRQFAEPDGVGSAEPDAAEPDVAGSDIAVPAGVVWQADAFAEVPSPAGAAPSDVPSPAGAAPSDVSSPGGAASSDVLSADAAPSHGPWPGGAAPSDVLSAGAAPSHGSSPGGAASSDGPSPVGAVLSGATEPADTVGPLPQGKPILVFGPEASTWRTRRAVLLAVATGVVVLAIVAALLVLNRPRELAVSAPPDRSPAASPPAGPPSAARIELADPTDRGNVVELSWHSSAPMDFAVVVAAEGEPARVLFVQRNTSHRVPVDPVRRYCFRVQGTDGAQVVESDPKPIRGAKCVT